MPSRRGLLLVVLLAAGCGSTTVAQEHRPRERPAAKPRAAFRVEAQRVCAGLEGRLTRIQKLDPESDRVWVELADAWSATIRKLRGLEAPPAQRARFKRMLAHFDRAVRAARAVPRVEREMVLAPIVAVLEEGGKGATIAQSLGLLRCSAVPPAPTAAERQRFNEYVKREARREFERWRRAPRLKQPAHPRRVRPRVEAPPGS